MRNRLFGIESSVLPEFKIENRQFFLKNAKINKKCSFYHFFSIFVQFLHFCPILSQFFKFVQFCQTLKFCPSFNFVIHFFNIVQFCPTFQFCLIPQFLSNFFKLFNFVQFCDLKHMMTAILDNWQAISQQARIERSEIRVMFT